MIKMNEEVYLQNLVFKKTYNDKGLVIGEIVFKNRISLEEYTNIQEKKDLILCDKLQNNWNELKKGLQSLFEFDEGVVSKDYLECAEDILEKMQELQGDDKN